ncbi:Radial spoke head protein 9 [Paragonimus westermani]|uniref:Radial spoke head protein 9 homolog n=1 Tax=Paragonimus westermani TaxID=34504 RepID=A0A8T0DUX9_9TREM|nr:Radial spoke head protein 9 [Paragonimus westermani]
MDADDLHLNIDYVGSCGIVLTPEQKATLQTSLTILKHENGFTNVLFWGTIRGVSGDYHIAQGIGKDAITSRKTLYSKDCLVWGVLPVPGKSDIEKSKYFKARFTGDPSYEAEFLNITQLPGEGDELVESEELITMKEEDRLAAVIERIENEVSIVPRGAYLRLASGQVVRNKSFEGLTVAEASKALSYFHFRPPIHLPHKPLADRAKLDKAIDFLDTIEDDNPNGCWAIQFERGSRLVLVKSLLWLGYVHYNLPGTNKYGSIYVGTGEYNIDLPFML